MFIYYLCNENNVLVGEFLGRSLPKNAVLVPPPQDAISRPIFDKEGLPVLNSNGSQEYTSITKRVRWDGCAWVEIDESEYETSLVVHNRDMEIRFIKSQRKPFLDNLCVTTQAGNTFEGDETSQDRMARAITAMEDADTLPWVLSDNTVVIVSKAELKEALRLASAAMSEIWVQPYK